MKCSIFFIKSASVIAMASVTVAAASERGRPAYPSGVIDCRAGCQGDVTGCRESSIKRVTIVADKGSHLLPGSMFVAKHWNASDSPGLVGEPKWVVVDQYPRGSSTPSWMTVAPDLSTCIGASGDTQGVTFYQLQMLQAP